MRMRETALFLLPVWKLCVSRLQFPVWHGNSGNFANI